MRKAFVKLCILCLAVSLLAGCEAKVSGSKFERCVTDGLYSEAISAYNEDIAGNAKKEAEAVSFLTEYLKEQLEAYANGDITEDEMRAALTTVENINSSVFILSDALYAAESKWSFLLSSKSSYQSGLEQLDRGDYLSALSYFQAVDPDDTENYSNAQSKYDEAMKKYLDGITEQVYADQSEENYEQALSAISQAENALGSSAELTTLRNGTMSAWKSALIQSARDAADSGNYILAVNTLADTQNYFSDDADIIACEDEICAAWSNDMIQRAKAAAEAGNYEEAISELNSGGTSIDNADIQACRSQIYESWRNSIIQQATDTAANDNYSDALDEIDQGLKLFPDDSDLISLRDTVSAQYEDYLRRTNPVSLTDLKPYQNKGIDVSSVNEDIMGNTYSTTLAAYRGMASATYRIDGIYQTFTGYFFVNRDSVDISRDVSIWGDGVRLFSASVDGAEDPTYFSVDVSGVRDLTIKMGIWGDISTYLGDPILTP